MPEVTLLRPRRLLIAGTGVLLERGKPKMVSAALGRALDGRPNVRVDWTATGAPEPEPEVEDESRGGRPADKAKRVAAIREAMAKLDPYNEAHYTRSGKPDARALTEVLGWQVTAGDRDEALETEPAAEEAETADGEAGSRVRIIRKPRAEPDPTVEGSVEV